MTFEQGLLAAVSLSWSTWLASFSIMHFRQNQLEKRMDSAGEKMSDMAGHVQAFPERMRDEFLTRREWEEWRRRE